MIAAVEGGGGGGGGRGGAGGRGRSGAGWPPGATGTAAAYTPDVSDAALEIDGLVKRYAGRSVADGLSLTAVRGAVTAVLGPNGAGKTTTIECCDGLRRRDGGTGRVLG